MDSREVVKCGVCGAESPPGTDAWCARCGAPLRADEDGWEIAAPEVVEAPAAEAEVEPARSTLREVADVGSTLMARLRARPRLLAGAAVIGLVVIAAVAVGSYLLATRDGAVYLYPVAVDGKIGFIDSSGDMVIEPRASDNLVFFTEFSEGLAAMSANGTTGFIDTRGEYAIEPAYAGASKFSEGLACVYQAGQAVYIDTTGRLAIEIGGMVEGGDFSEGLAYFAEADVRGSVSYGYLDRRGNVVITPRFITAASFSEGLACVTVRDAYDAPILGFIDRSGAWAIQPVFAAAMAFSEGLAAAAIADEAGNLTWGYIDKTGAWAIEPSFESTSEFSEGLAAVAVADRAGTMTWGYVDKKGAWVIDPSFGWAGEFSEGLAVAQRSLQLDQSSPAGYIDKTGRWVIEPKYESAWPFQPGGIAMVTRADSVLEPGTRGPGVLPEFVSSSMLVYTGYVSYINKKGEVVWSSAGAASFSTGDPMEQVGTVGVHGGDPYPVLVDGKVGYINASGRVVIAPGASSLWAEFSEGLARTEVAGKVGYVDRSGRLVIAPECESAGDFSQGLAWVSRAGTRGYIDRTGVLVVTSAGWSDGAEFSDGRASVATVGDGGLAYGFIDTTGAMVIEARFAEARDFSEGLAAVGEDQGGGRRLWGYIDAAGAWVIEPSFESAGDFSEGLAPVAAVLDENTIRWGFVDTTGAWAIEPSFESAGEFSEGLAPVQLGFLSGLASPVGFIDKTGRVVIEPNFLVVTDFSHGLAAAQVYDGELWGYIDTSGSWVIEPQCKAAAPFSREGIGLVVRAGETPPEMTWQTYPEGLREMQRAIRSFIDTRPLDIAYIDKDGTIVWETTSPR